MGAEMCIRDRYRELIMDTSVAFTIIGFVLGFVGIMFNIFPKQINQKLMGDLSEEASLIAPGFRIILGGVGITLAIVALSSRNFSPAEAKSLLYALGTGFVVIDQVHIEGNEVSANESNANLELSGNGSGLVSIAGA